MQGVLNVRFNHIHLFTDMVTTYFKLHVCNCSKVPAYKMTVFRWLCHEHVVLGWAYKDFTFEVVLTSPVSSAILGFATGIHKIFQSNFAHCISVLTSGSEIFHSCQLPVDTKER